MKKLLCIISIALCILLSACGNATSIGIIGGADGPTEVIVAKKGDRTMYEQITVEEAKEILPEQEKQILVYCRSGRRRKIALKAWQNSVTRM